jgi:hypothetical protein
LSERGQPLDRDTIAALDKLTDVEPSPRTPPKTPLTTDFVAPPTPQPPKGGDDKTPSEPEHQKARPVENDGGDPTSSPSEPPSEAPTNNDPENPVVDKDDNGQPAPPEDNKSTPSEPEQKSTETPESDDKDNGNPEKPDNDDDNLKQPEDDKPKPAEPENDDTKQEAENSQERDGEKPGGPCGDDCQCAKTFNDVSRNEDGTVDLILTNGDTVTVEAKDADKMIDTEVKEKLEIADDSWKNTLDQFDGDKVKAFEYLTEQSKQEAGLSEKYVGPTTDLDGQPAVNELAEQMRAMKDSHSKPSNDGKPTASGPFHECGSGCNHGTPQSGQGNKAGQTSVEIDTNTLRKAETGDKPKKKKKTKSPAPK